MKHNNICIIGIPEGEEEESGIENWFEKVMMENFPNLRRAKVTQIQETQRVPSKRNPTRLTANYIKIKKEIETINKRQEEMKNTISELKNTVEGIKSRLDEAEDRISELEDKVEKNTQKEQEKERGSERMKRQ